MKILGLTGGIGMGKSTVATLLAGRGAAIADTDRLARDIVQPGQPALTEIQAEFGGQFIRPDGSLDRHALGAIVFADPVARKKLEAITHPQIRRLWQIQVEAWSVQGRPWCVVVIPLLFETGSEKSFDATLCVACTAVSQQARLRQRGWTDTQIGQRNAAQLPIQKKIVLADYVIWNEGLPDLIPPQIDRILASLAL